MSDEFYRRGIREPDPTLGRHAPVPPPGRQSRQPPTPGQRQGHPGQENGQQQGPFEQAPPGGPPHLRQRRRRVVLASPSRAQSSLRARVELEQQTSWGELLIKDLIKAQLRTGLALAAVVLAVLGALPLAFFLSPEFAQLRLFGIPVAWLLLGVGPFPLLFGVGLWYNRLAERHERDFVNLVEK